ncbi:hypothetical protein CDV36_015796 [Fusarium kuroshium]|uniref:Uncharacterized protein n=1 Tax=Fusarium kuroshium TaxID=2010991 RepID=A0A3M2R8A4_9HYPO|nr:hypothetical protein CDV36_015796 [Fusarium kuroshium]
MPPQQTNQSTNSQSTATSATSATTSSGAASSGSKPPSRYRVIKDGWGGDRPAFQYSYSLGMDPTSIAEGNEIIDAMIKHEYGYNDNKER